MGLTSKLLLPVAGDLTSLGLHGLFALSSTPGAFPGAQPTISAGGHTHTPLPFSTVRLLHFLFWKEGDIVNTRMLFNSYVKLSSFLSTLIIGSVLFTPIFSAQQIVGT